MSQNKKIRRVLSASPKQVLPRKRQLRRLTWEQVGRPWPPDGENMLAAPRDNEQVRLDLVKKLLAGAGEHRGPSPYPKFSKRDLERANLVVWTFAPDLAPEIEALINLKYPGPRKRPGHPHDPMAERAALAFELLRSCRARRLAHTIHTILKTMGKHITVESIERDYRRRNSTRLVRISGGFTDRIPAGDLHRVPLWRLQAILSPNAFGIADSVFSQSD